jgi:hypothetical protein
MTLPLLSVRCGLGAGYLFAGWLKTFNSSAPLVVVGQDNFGGMSHE